MNEALLPRFSSKPRGGEGVELLVTNRDKNGFDASGNWFITVFSLRGRAVPVVPLLSYYLYSIAIVTVLMLGFRKQFVDCEGQGCLVESLTVPVSFIGSALFFLLVFRTNSSYDRWWEGRNLWANIMSTCRNLGRQAAVLITDKHLARELIQWTMAFPVILAAHLRGEKSTAVLDGAEMTQNDISNILNAEHMPLYVLMRITTILRICVKRNLLSDFQLTMLDENLASFQSYIAGVERIMKTPMPFAYVAHLRSFMVLWLAALPFALIHDLRWVVIPICIVIGFAIMGIEAIGVEIENPFGRDFNDLPLDTLVRKCIENLTQMLDFLESRPPPIDTTIVEPEGDVLCED
ncbi:hypothetical protein BSKO_05895 [Bryopsis sp. KO-2023]|nr:hypothetical protein BSKO_05895 [Bryopsis sp. KO-2023]